MTPETSDTRERVHRRAKELYDEFMADLPPGVPVATDVIYQECWERAEEEEA